MIASLLCSGGFCLFVFFMIVGVVVLRRRGKKVTAKKAMQQGVESVSQVFVRGSGGLEDFDDDDDDDDDE
jgi:hypothetical protein